jgi:hypothetical protein
MFHAKRARHEEAADNQINNSLSAQSALAGPSQHPPRNSSPPQPAVVRCSKAVRSAGVRPGPVLLAIALALAFIVVLTGAASAAATQDAPGQSVRTIVRLELQPTSAVVAVGAPVVYRAKAVFLDRHRADVTKYTVFSINGGLLT